MPSQRPNRRDFLQTTAAGLAVAGLAGTRVPPPAVTVKVTFNPLTGFPLTSVTRTDGAAATAAPTVPDCETAELAAMVWAEPALTVIVPEVTLTNPPDAKIKVRGPTVPVILRLLNVATPDALVVAFRVPPRVPAPLWIATVTTTPAWSTGLLPAS